MARQLTWHEAIQRVLAKSPVPLHYLEITERILAEGLRTTLGATPGSTVGAQISDSIKRDGMRSPYRRVGRGTYTVADRAPGVEVAAPQDSEVQLEVISSFGMFWQRVLVDWGRSQRLLGQQPGAAAVDFAQQRGVYLLYDSREVIYVGRAVERGLGVRLFEHTTDRLAARWDRFSWFGIRPVSDAGALGDAPPSFSADLLLPTLEAILIEAVEPRQNRKRGDDLATVEFIQCEDPSLRKRKLKDDLTEILDRE